MSFFTSMLSNILFWLLRFSIRGLEYQLLAESHKTMKRWMTILQVRNCFKYFCHSVPLHLRFLRFSILSHLGRGNVSARNRNWIYQIIQLTYKTKWIIQKNDFFPVKFMCSVYSCFLYFSMILISDSDSDSWFRFPPVTSNHGLRYNSSLTKMLLRYGLLWLALKLKWRLKESRES